MLGGTVTIFCQQIYCRQVKHVGETEFCRQFGHKPGHGVWLITYFNENVFHLCSARKGEEHARRRDHGPRSAQSLARHGGRRVQLHARVGSTTQKRILYMLMYCAMLARIWRIIKSVILIMHPSTDRWDPSIEGKIILARTN